MYNVQKWDCLKTGYLPGVWNRLVWISNIYYMYSECTYIGVWCKVSNQNMEQYGNRDLLKWDLCGIKRSKCLCNKMKQINTNHISPVFSRGWLAQMFKRPLRKKKQCFPKDSGSKQCLAGIFFAWIFHEYATWSLRKKRLSDMPRVALL